MTPRLLLTFLSLAVWCCAQDRGLSPNSETAFERFSNRSKVIQPGLMVYGVPWTSTIEEFQKSFGTPAGRFAVRNDAVALIYGRSHVLLFEKGELREVSIDSRLFNYVLEPHILPHPFFDARDLTIAPGVRLGMSPAEILAVLPGKFSPPGEREHTSSCTLEHASLKLWYSIRRTPGSTGDIKTLMSVTIRGH